jgi:hypothetical protein
VSEVRRLPVIGRTFDLEVSGILPIEALDEDPETARSAQAAGLGAKNYAASAPRTENRTVPELGEPVDERTDLPTLIKRALKALGLQPEVLAPDAEGAEVT